MGLSLPVQTLIVNNYALWWSNGSNSCVYGVHNDQSVARHNPTPQGRHQSNAERQENPEKDPVNYVRQSSPLVRFHPPHLEFLLNNETRIGSTRVRRTGRDDVITLTKMAVNMAAATAATTFVSSDRQEATNDAEKRKCRTTSTGR